jgi:hypothetical protein
VLDSAVPGASGVELLLWWYLRCNRRSADPGVDPMRTLSDAARRTVACCACLLACLRLGCGRLLGLRGLRDRSCPGVKRWSALPAQPDRSPNPSRSVVARPRLLLFVDGCWSYALSTHLAFMPLLVCFKACFLLLQHHSVSRACFPENRPHLILGHCLHVLLRVHMLVKPYSTAVSPPTPTIRQ